jgi:hypothetical protein
VSFNPRLANSRQFYLLGFVLILVSLITFPIEIPLAAQQIDYDYYGVGWLFAPIIGFWGLASLTLGLMQSDISKSKVKVFLTPILVLIVSGLLFSGWMLIITRLNAFWGLYFSMCLIPSLLTISLTILFFRSEQKFNDFFSKLPARLSFFALAIAIPAIYSVSLLLSLIN